MENVSGIYGILSKCKQRYYIGQAIDIESRWNKHKSCLSRNCHHSPKLQHHFNKYGIDDLEFFIVSELEAKKEFNTFEKFFIACFDSWKNGFNCTQGGDGGAWRKCRLQNIETGEIVETESLGEFAKQVGIKCQGLIGRVLDGKANFVGDWFNPDGNWKPNFRSLRDPDGNIHTFHFIGRFCQKHNLDTICVLNLLSGRLQTIKNGWTRVDGVNYKPVGNYFNLIDPSGNIHKGRNLREFARNYNLTHEDRLDGNVLTEVIAGRSGNHKGWRKYIEGQTPTEFEFPNKEFKFVSPEGEVFTTDNITQFALSKGLNPKNLSMVWAGKRNHHAYWTKFIKDADIKPFYRKTYEFISPAGVKVSTHNINELARKEGLVITNLHRVIKGEYKQHKGWKLHRII